MKIDEPTPSSSKTPNRTGVILPLAAVCLTIVLGFAALCVDLGVLFKARAEAQNCADAAAMAAAGELYPSMEPQTAIKLSLLSPIYQPVRPYPKVGPAIEAAKRVAQANRCGDTHQIVLLDSDISFGIAEGGILVGPTPTLPLVDGLLSLLNLRTADATFVNAATVTIRRDTQANTPLKLFFAPALGKSNHSFQSTATAAIYRGYGLQPGDKMLPFAMDITIWNALRFTNGTLSAVTLKPLGVDLNSITLSGLLGSNFLTGLLDSLLPLALSGSPIHILDGFTHTRGMASVVPGADGINEAVLLADQTVTINKPLLNILGIVIGSIPVTKRIPSLMISLETGPSGSGVPNAARMNSVIRDGLTASDIQNIAGPGARELWLPFTMKGYFEIPTACEAELIAAIGKPRIMPLYATLPGTLNKVTDILGFPHQFQMVGWVGVVITEVNLSGPVRYINVQPAVYARHTILPAHQGDSSVTTKYMSDGVFTTPRLIK